MNTHGARLGLQALLLIASCLLVHSGPALENATCIGEVFEALGFTKENFILSRPDQCLKQARLLPPEPEFLAALQPRSRQLPPRVPELSAYDWNTVIRERPPGWPNPPIEQCPSELNIHLEILRLKIYNGVVYAHFPHDSEMPLSRRSRYGARDMVYEMLMLFMYLYKDVPDMDLAVNTVDHAINCNWTIPMLQHVAVNMTSPSTGVTLDISPEHYACRGPAPKPDATCVGYSKGYTFSTPDAWRHLALSPKQLWWYSYCMHAHYVRTLPGQALNACRVPRKPIAFWRGSASGHVWGWSTKNIERWERKYNASRQSQYLYSATLNKRIALTLLASKYYWMDVAMSHIQSQYLHGFKDYKENELVNALLLNISNGDRMVLEEWNKHHLLINVDGQGPAFRLPKLMLANVPVVKVESILREWYFEHAIPGVHYEAVRYDLSDVAERTRVLLEEAQRDSRRLEKMAVAAAKLTVDRVNWFAQMDAFAWSLMRIKELSAWQVLPPNVAVSKRPGDANAPVESGWHIVKLRPDRKPQGLHAIPPNVWESIRQQFAHNFL